MLPGRYAVVDRLGCALQLLPVAEVTATGVAQLGDALGPPDVLDRLIPRFEVIRVVGKPVGLARSHVDGSSPAPTVYQTPCVNCGKR